MSFSSLLYDVFCQPLPGWNAQRIMSPVFREEQLILHDTPEQEAAVGILLFEQYDELQVLFIERTQDGGPHSGQIAFPGGAKDELDPNLKETALREIQEEIGLTTDTMSFVGSLSPLYIPVSKFLVYPFVFFLSEEPKPIINTSEVNAVYTFPVKNFYDEKVSGQTTIKLNGCAYQVPCFIIDGIVIWGATSMIWNECLTLLKPLFGK